jgi:HPt (histidine-containing phosphotransfer) domain-containing protein
MQFKEQAMAPTSPPAPPWVYLDIARALEQTGDDEALRTMLPMLQELLERNVPQITQSLTAQDVGAASPLLHALKGVLPIFCAPALCEQLAEVEHMSKTGEGPAVGEAFAALQPQLQALQQEITQYLTPTT